MLTGDESTIEARHVIVAVPPATAVAHIDFGDALGDRETGHPEDLQVHVVLAREESGDRERPVAAVT